MVSFARAAVDLRRIFTLCISVSLAGLKLLEACIFFAFTGFSFILVTLAVLVPTDVESVPLSSKFGYISY